MTFIHVYLKISSTYSVINLGALKFRALITFHEDDFVNKRFVVVFRSFHIYPISEVN